MLAGLAHFPELKYNVLISFVASPGILLLRMLLPITNLPVGLGVGFGFLPKGALWPILLPTARGLLRIFNPSVLEST
ncbi:MAG: hypothetical protein Q7R47_05285 [Candidatus Diapherotrites archaeon]|nr:hypothetical protein [Candidatus Diapherotrites archaeon]